MSTFTASLVTAGDDDLAMAVVVERYNQEIRALGIEGDLDAIEGSHFYLWYLVADAFGMGVTFVGHDVIVYDRLLSEERAKTLASA